MPYDPTKDRAFSQGQRAAPRPDDPATGAVRLTSAMVSDTTDLPTYAKAFRIWNGSGALVTLMVTPLHATDDTAAGAVPLTLPAGVVGYEAMAVRRIWSTGSTGLGAGLVAGTVEVLLLTE
jgi:hypothetical protein